jgi:hypothetical protein
MTPEEKRRLELGLRVLGACCSGGRPSRADIAELAACAAPGEADLPLDEVACRMVQRALQQCRGEGFRAHAPRKRRSGK